MFLVTLRFAANKAQASEHMEAHNAWIGRGFAEGVFLLTGSLAGGAGGAVLAHGVSREDLDVRLRQDPFVAAGVVSTDVLEIAPGRVDHRLAFLKG